MCGIFGITMARDSKISNRDLKKMISKLFLLSESRGKEASGLAVKTNSSLFILKQPKPASVLLRSKEYNQLFNNLGDVSAIIGHARLVTNGSLEDNSNNQPVVSEGIVGIHNGIMTNDADLWSKFPALKRMSEVDTEVFLSLIRYFLKKERNIHKSVSDTFNLIEGSASISLLFNNFDLQLLATNTGSLYYYKDDKFFVYASEEAILNNFLTIFKFKSQKITQLKPNHLITIDLNNFMIVLDSLKVKKSLIKILPTERLTTIRDLSPAQKSFQVNKNILTDKMIDKFNKQYLKCKTIISKLPRCTKCLLPSTMPLISFDRDGVCNYCHNYKKGEHRGLTALNEALKPYKSGSDKPNCIVSFSGGRDSCYALHYVKKVLKLNPIAYSYDWGMLTDLGRRNQARMCGKLGVEHLLVSADIQQKRNYIRQNVTAWLKKPKLGMIPLFMAGDKQYFYYLNKLKQETGIDLVIYADNFLEKTDFKYGFAKVDLESGVKKAYQIGKYNSIKLLLYYLNQFFQNSAYLNSSLFDTFTAYVSSYIVPKDYLYLYRYLKWDEKTINNTLISQYNWELSPDTKSTWRIGDGTASFYNYIYYTMAGFTENDTFRSNQIREGLITRKEGLALAESENHPRWESIRWYCDTIGINMEQTLQIINSSPRLY